MPTISSDIYHRKLLVKLGFHSPIEYHNQILFNQSPVYQDKMIAHQPNTFDGYNRTIFGLYHSINVPHLYNSFLYLYLLSRFRDYAMSTFHTLSQVIKFQISLISFLQALSIAAGKAFNITVDDQYGGSMIGEAPVYSPLGVWNQGPQCTGCFIQPDPSQAFNGTWHDSTIDPSDVVPYNISYTFKGK